MCKMRCGTIVHVLNSPYTFIESRSDLSHWKVWRHWIIIIIKNNFASQEFQFGLKTHSCAVRFTKDNDIPFTCASFFKVCVQNYVTRYIWWPLWSIRVGFLVVFSRRMNCLMASLCLQFQLYPLWDWYSWEKPRILIRWNALVPETLLPMFRLSDRVFVPLTRCHRSHPGCPGLHPRSSVQSPDVDNIWVVTTH